MRQGEAHIRVVLLTHPKKVLRETFLKDSKVE
jgi:hypothetical protein